MDSEIDAVEDFCRRKRIRELETDARDLKVKIHMVLVAIVFCIVLTYHLYLFANLEV